MGASPMRQPLDRRSGDLPVTVTGRAGPSQPAMRIRNLDGGQTVEITIEGDVAGAGLADLQRRLAHLIEVRQPAHLRLDVGALTGVEGSEDAWDGTRGALAAVGGRLTFADG